MKSLLLLRHAKSSWKEIGCADHDRGLNRRGKRDAARMGRLLRAEGLTPDLVLVSSAKRARRTAKRALRGGEIEAEVVIVPALYHAEPELIIEVVAEVDDDFETVLVIGHNPGLEELAQALAGVPQDMPTGALAQFEVDVDAWSELETDASARLRGFWRPRELPPVD